MIIKCWFVIYWSSYTVTGEVWITGVWFHYNLDLILPMWHLKKMSFHFITIIQFGDDILSDVFRNTLVFQFIATPCISKPCTVTCTCMWRHWAIIDPLSPQQTAKRYHVFRKISDRRGLLRMGWSIPQKGHFPRFPTIYYMSGEQLSMKQERPSGPTSGW